MVKSTKNSTGKKSVFPLICYDISIEQLYCIVYHMFCIVYHMFCIVYHMFCIVYHMFCIVYHMFCIVYHTYVRTCTLTGWLAEEVAIAFSLG